EVGHGGVVEAGEDSGEVGAVGADESDACAGGSVASPDVSGGIFRSVAGLASDHELMGGEAGAGIGLKHAVAEGVALGEVPIRLDVGGWDVGVGKEAAYVVEAVQVAVVALVDATGV